MTPGNIDKYLNTPYPAAGAVRSLLCGIRKPILLDIGACEGEESIRFSHMFPHAEIHCFEPVPENVRLIRKNLKQYQTRKVHVNECALSDQNGGNTFHLSSGEPPEKFSGDHWNYGNKSGSLLEPASDAPMFGWIHFNRTTEVACMRLDEYAVKQNLRRIDWMHLDVQGAELLVLKGAGKFLQRTRAVWLEAMNEPLYQGQVEREELEQFLKREGFSLVATDNREHESDLLFVNRRFFSGKFLLLRYRISHACHYAARQAFHLLSRIAYRSGFTVIRNHHPAVRYVKEMPTDALRYALHQAFDGLSNLTFIQLGANDGVHCDPLHCLLQRYHWRGLRVEPQAHLASELRTQSPPDITIVSAAIGNKSGNVSLFYIDDCDSSLPDYASGLATLDRRRIEQACQDLNINASRIASCEVPLITWQQLLEKFPFQQVDLLVTEVEGMDISLLKLWDWRQLRPRIVMFEHACSEAAERFAFYQQLSGLGYELVTMEGDTVAYLPKNNR